jgi:hypothetical protein
MDALCSAHLHSCSLPSLNVGIGIVLVQCVRWYLNAARLEAYSLPMCCDNGRAKTVASALEQQLHSAVGKQEFTQLSSHSSCTKNKKLLKMCCTELQELNAHIFTQD